MATTESVEDRGEIATAPAYVPWTTPFARLRVSGQCQGVGYRPFVYHLANTLDVTGSVRNDPAGVVVEAWAPDDVLDELAARLSTDAPPLATIESVTWEARVPPAEVMTPTGFTIATSDADAADERGCVTVDASVCADCLAEFRSPRDRRFRHALINCTNCGPRYTIVQDLPYDRSRTTMASFAMCPRCTQEYLDPGDRRFHAQPTCCGNCGPRVRLIDSEGAEWPRNEDSFCLTAEILTDGGIVAMKGLGGFHLAVDATNVKAVGELRRRKNRDHKPFAVMVADLATAQTLCDLSPEGVQALVSPVSPIVIAPWRPAGVASVGLAVDGIAPGHHRLGLMLPNPPMQHLLAEEHPGPVVMTSANVSDDPLVRDDEELVRLDGLADVILTHNRPIERAVDDSVVVDRPGHPPVPVRRARGLVPGTIRLPLPASEAGICMGADLKNAVAVVHGDVATVSQHLGDLNHVLAHRRFTRTAADLERLLDVDPAWVAVDLHPRYLSRRHGIRQAAARGLTVVEVQHHHAHLASLLAEHQRTDTVVGLTCDGVGLGSDGTSWGGEILVGDLGDFARRGRTRPLLLPGGDVAAKRVGRAAISWMTDALGEDNTAMHPAAERLIPDPRERKGVQGMLRSGLACPASSGLGRLFDAAAALLGLCDYNHHEAFAAQLLESAAAGATTRPSGSGLLGVAGDQLLEIDTRPLLRALLGGQDAGAGTSALAYLFHDAVADGLARGAISVAHQEGIGTIGLTGGCFCNVLLTELVVGRLEDAGLEVLTHSVVPPNDGGIALGQAAVAAARRERHD
jgi:hydrogenase maturation protein HypF